MSLATILTGQIIEFVYNEGGYAFRASSTGIYDTQKQHFRTAPKKGVSDILACYFGRLIAIEVKIGTDRLSSEQTGFLKNVEHAGGIAIVAKDFETFKEQWTKAVKLL